MFFLSCFFFNLNFRKLGSFDSVASSLLPFNLWEGNGLVLDSLAEIYPAGQRYSIVRSRHGHAVSLYPIVTPLLATPLYLPWKIAKSAGIVEGLGPWPPILEKYAASAIAAASVAAVFLLLDRLTRRRHALILTAAYALGTSTWTISSQSLWPHGTAELLLALCLLLLLERNPGPLPLTLLGLSAGLLTANRPVAVVFSLAVAALVLRRNGPRAWPFFAASLLVAALWIAYNTTHFESFLGGYGDWRTADGKPIWMASSGLRGFAGLLISNRGLLVFSPFLLLFFAAPRAALAKFPGLGLLLFACLAFLYLCARTPDWAGGYSYGPRFATDALPVLILAMVGPLERLSSLAGKTLFALALAFSIFLQAVGAFCFPGGDSGSEYHGFWNARRSSPVLAFQAGLQTPHFTYVLFPSLGVRTSLPQKGVAAAYAWAAPLPRIWRARESHRIALRVANAGDSRWSSFGGWMGFGAVRLNAFWRSAADGPRHAFPPSDFWFAAHLGPGESTTRRVLIRAPNASGRFQLCVGLSQVFLGAFSGRGVPPLCSETEVHLGALASRGEDAVEWGGGSGPAELAEGESGTYHVSVRNLSEREWPDTVRVSYHWRQSDGPHTLFDGQRTPLPQRVAAGKTVWVDAAVLAEVPPGTYDLEFDLVTDTWFSWIGSPPLVVEVRVRSAR